MRGKPVKITRAIFVVLLLLLFCPNIIFADSITFFCRYPKYSDEQGIHSEKNIFSLTFLVDKKRGTAFIIGNQGSEEVKLLSSGLGFTFIEITGAGNVMTTTIDAFGHSVHSRNTVIGGKLVPTQYYGSCELK